MFTRFWPRLLMICLILIATAAYAQHSGTAQARPAERPLASTAGYRLPFSGTRIITAGPGCSGTHGGLSGEAIDYSMSLNDPIYATQSGRVSYSLDGWNDGFGNLIKVTHNDGNVSWYAHLNLRAVNLNDLVSQGQLIGYAGTTGNSTGVHLHFEVRNSAGQPLSIRYLPTTTWYTGNPSQPCMPAGQNDGSATYNGVNPTPPPTTPTTPPGGANCASYLGDVNYPDGTVVAPGSTITKRWRMQNCGTTNWSGYRAVQVSGSFGPASFAVSGAPGATVELAVSMVNHLTPGRYRTTYQLATSAGVRFGPTFWVEVVVQGGGATPTPTAPPQGTNCATFLGDVNYPDGTVVGRGSTIVKRWRMQNCGTANWSGYRAVMVSGSFGPSSFAVSGAPGTTVELAVSMVNHLTPGRYRTTYQLATGAGVRFGPTFWVEVVVQ